MKKFNFNIFKKPYIILILLTAICIVSVGISAMSQSASKPFKVVAGVFIVPLQRGINQIGSWFSDQRRENLSLEEALDENEKLKQQVQELEAASQQHANDSDEITRLNGMLQLKDTYQNYNTVGASIIMKNSGSNWYRKFTIDKGSEDGLAVDMNVIATGGLVGIITDIGPHYSIVTSIIDESSKVSGMLRKTLDTCIVAGDMAGIRDGKIRLEYMSQNFNNAVDNIIVTSTISDKYVPGIVIGRAVDITVKNNKLTKTGYLIPAVDFERLKDVLVITTLKQSMSAEEVEKIKKELAEPETTAAESNKPQTSQEENSQSPHESGSNTEDETNEVSSETAPESTIAEE